MKKLNNKGFVMAETLIVSVFLMVIFTMIYSNFYPIIGEYEKRENYDDVDGKYTAYWIKKIIESDAYVINTKGIIMMNQLGYIRFNCSDVSTDDNQRELCISMVKALEISNCDANGNGCDIYITRYQIGGYDETDSKISFKDLVRDNKIKRWNEVCINTSNPYDEGSATASDSSCATKEFKTCCEQKGLGSCTSPVLSGTVNNYGSLYSDSNKDTSKDKIAKYCNSRLAGKVFPSHIRDYVLSLPNYTVYHGATGAYFRVIVVVHHEKDSNNYYSFSTMEVIK